MADLAQLAEGKTKAIFQHQHVKDHVMVRSKDRISAFNNQRSDDLQGKSQLSTHTNCIIYQFLNDIGVKTHFIGQLNETEFEAEKCAMIPLEWIIRRVATGSFLKRNPGVKQGFRFSPPKVEITFKDDAQGDPIWSEEMVVESGMIQGGRHIGVKEVDRMRRVSRVVFEVLEKCWARLGCSLIDMKIEFGVNSKGEMVLADVIDSDSWRLWPSGDPKLQLDKQFYRDLKEVTPEALQQLKTNFATVIEYMQKFTTDPVGRVMIVMGSASDMEHAAKIRKACMNLGMPTHIRISSAHKGTEETMQLLAEYEGDNIPTVVIAVAGRSNGLGPVSSGNSCFPIINSPPPSQNMAQDIWSSLNLPSGLGCSTVLDPGNAAICAANILSLSDHMVWCRLRVKSLNTHISLMEADLKLKSENESNDDKLFVKEHAKNGFHNGTTVS